MSTKVVIISGKKQAGKDTACDTLMSSLKPVVSCTKYSFADPLKQFLINVFGLTWAQCYGTDADKNSPSRVKWEDLPLDGFKKIDLMKSAGTPTFADTEQFLTARQLMQIFGSDICRKMYPDCWALGTKNKILAEKPGVAFICDARFPNEIDVLADTNPIIIRLKRSVSADTHFSETALDDYDFSKFGANFIEIDNSNMDMAEKNKLLWSKVSVLL
jgi:hypothetical protein